MKAARFPSSSHDDRAKSGWNQTSHQRLCRSAPAVHRPRSRMSSPAGKTVSHHRGLAALLASLSALGPFSIDAYLPSMAEIGRTLNASPWAVQQTLTAYLLPFGVMTLWHGAVSDAL